MLISAPLLPIGVITEEPSCYQTHRPWSYTHNMGHPVECYLPLPRLPPTRSGNLRQVSCELDYLAAPSNPQWVYEWLLNLDFCKQRTASAIVFATVYSTVQFSSAEMGLSLFYNGSFVVPSGTWFYRSDWYVYQFSCTPKCSEVCVDLKYGVTVVWYVQWGDCQVTMQQCNKCDLEENVICIKLRSCYPVSVQSVYVV
jgi:hypothetical protein